MSSLENEKPAVQHISISTKNPSLISGGDIGVVVKHYLNKSFYTYEDFKISITRKFALTSEQRKIFDEKKYEKMQFIFAKGSKFEAEVTKELMEKYSDTFEIINFNHFDKMIFASDDMGICAVPDIFLKSDNDNILCEVKYAECGGNATQNYKYQVVAQSLLIDNFYDVDTVPKLFFGIPNKTTNETVITISPEEKQELSNDIKNAIKLLQQDIANNALQFYTFDEMMERFKDRPSVESDDDKLLALVEKRKELDIWYAESKLIEAEYKKNTEAIKALIGNGTIDVNIQSPDGSRYKIKQTVKADTIWTEELVKEQIAEAQNAKIGSVKRKNGSILKIEIL